MFSPFDVLVGLRPEYSLDSGCSMSPQFSWPVLLISCVIFSIPSARSFHRFWHRMLGWTAVDPAVCFGHTSDNFQWQ